MAGVPGTGAKRPVAARNKVPPTKIPASNEAGILISALRWVSLFAIAKQAQQHQEQVDEVQIETQGTH